MEMKSEHKVGRKDDAALDWIDRVSDLLYFNTESKRQLLVTCTLCSQVQAHPMYSKKI
jgi:hypothetical protein